MKKRKICIAENERLLNEWDWNKNKEVNPIELTCGSNKKVWWICKNGHEWEARINDRDKGRGCPICSGKKVLYGYNDLMTTHQNIALQWDYDKNNNLTPQNISAGSNKKVWWKCEKGHSWLAEVCTRTKGSNCPICAKIKRVKQNKKNQINNKGSLASNHSELMKEWHKTKNINLNPNEVLSGSIKKVWWKCENGHEWQARISHRANGSGCPICNINSQSSFPEQALFYYLSQIFYVEHRKKIFGMEIDVYIPELRIGIEYDGMYFHGGKATKIREDKKNKNLAEKGICLIRIKETKEIPINNNENIIYCIPENRNKHMNYTINLLIEKLEFIIGNKIMELNVNVQRDELKIKNLFIQMRKENSAFSINPKLQHELHPVKNGMIKLDNVSPNTHLKMWWICQTCGHEWETSVSNRIKGSGCPVCSRKISVYKKNLSLIAKQGSLQEYYPDISKEWNYKRNGVLSPCMVTKRSGRKVWWICKNGHEWEAIISNRTKGSGCPICSGQKVLAGYNDLETINPILAKEWNFIKNKDITPKEVTCGSEKKVWWICPTCGYEWQARVKDRTRGTRCPICLNSKK